MNHITFSTAIMACAALSSSVVHGGIAIDCPTPDFYENNDDPSNAVGITAGVVTSLNVDPSDPDFFSITIPAGAELRVEATSAFPLTITGSSGLPGVGFPCEPRDGSYFVLNNSGIQVLETFGVESLIVAACIEYELLISIVPTPGNQVDCYEPNDTCPIAPTLSNGSYGGLWLNSGDTDFYSFNVRSSDTLSVGVIVEGNPFCEAIEGTLINGDAVACGGSVTVLLDADNFSSFFLSWTNTSSADREVVLRLNNIAFLCPSNQTDFRYGLVVAGASPPGLGVFCAPMDANSSGLPTRLGALWGSGFGTGATLTATDGPPGQWGYVLVSDSNIDPGILVGGGRLCLSSQNGQPIGRYNIPNSNLSSIGFFTAFGEFRNASNSSSSGFGFDIPKNLPIPGSSPVLPGQTLNFQLWHRDVPFGSNFSNGLSITF